jgi:Second Messenger Oligonucleotide or Dinucleotide Synthetase domain
MMGGSGGYFPSGRRNIDNLLDQTESTEIELEKTSKINKYLQSLLIDLNKRDAQEIKNHLDDIKNAVGDEIELDDFLFGGSVAKHTYVDGLSDVDVLAIVNKDKWRDKNPQFILNIMERYLKNKLGADKFESISKGKLAITIYYKDKTELQILPALRTRQKIFIADPKTKGWNETKPKAFMTKLSQLNQQLNGTLIPVIKIAKSIIAKLPEQKQPTGYHLENLAARIFTNYNEAPTYKSMLHHFFKKAGFEVLKPIHDVTGQSRTVDSDLGAANSNERRIVADGFASIERKLNASYSEEQWKQVCE